MKSVGLLPMFLLAVEGFAPGQLPTSTTTTTELNALGLRTAGRFVKRKIFRRGQTDDLQVVMKEDDKAKVQDGAPVVVPEEETEEEEVTTLSEETEQTIASIVTVQTVDTLFEQGNPEEAKELLLKEFSKGIDTEKSGPLYWRLVKAHYEFYSAAKDEQQQKQYLEKGLELVDTVCPSILEADDSGTTQAYLWKWKAILLGKLGGFQSTKEKMGNSFVIKESLEQAQAIMVRETGPDPSIYQALGEWCFKVANISFLERQAASVLFGKPPTSSYKEALDYFKKGYELKATPAMATKLAETYQRMGDKSKAEEWFAKANEEAKM